MGTHISRVLRCKRQGATERRHRFITQSGQNAAPGCNGLHGFVVRDDLDGCGQVAARSRARTIYVPAFRANDIDGEVLLRLTAEDLRELGVASIGHRRRLLDAIATLGDSQPAAEARAIPGAVTAGEAERRQLTVMFCDLVGSTALSARLDPEDLREVIAGYHRAVTQTVAGFEGFVAKYMGDGVLIYFGYPRAHEDDAERAIRAGLGLIDAVGRLNLKSVKLQARVGIATGLVVVGDLIGEGVIGEIVDRTDGVPLFVEELTKSVLESGLLREEGDRYVLDRTLPPLAIPTSLHDSLMARLDRLASVRLVAQIGAANRTRVSLRAIACGLSSSRGRAAIRSRSLSRLRAGLSTRQAA
jgi:class 3 adenylate cyclase